MESKDKIYRIKKIEIHPEIDNKREKEIKDSFSPLKDNEFSIETLKKTVQSKLKKIINSGYYKEIESNLELNDKFKIAYDMNEPIDSKLRIGVKTIKKSNLNISHFYDSDRDLNIKVEKSFFDLLKLRENLKIGVEKSLKGTSNIDFGLSKKVDIKRGCEPIGLGLELYKRSAPKKLFTSIGQDEFGMKITTRNDAEKFNIAYNLSKRRNYPDFTNPNYENDPMLEPFIQNPSWKSSFSFEKTLCDTFKTQRDYFPVGSFIKVICEIAGLGKGEKFFKIEANHGIYHLFDALNGISLGLRSKFGYLHSRKRSHIADRFFSGRNEDLMGFHENCISPKSQMGNAVGGDLLLSTILTSKIPLFRLQNERHLFHLELFGGCGNIITPFQSNSQCKRLHSISDLKDFAKDLRGGFIFNAGINLNIPLYDIFIGEKSSLWEERDLPFDERWNLKIGCRINSKKDTDFKFRFGFVYSYEC